MWRHAENLNIKVKVSSTQQSRFKVEVESYITPHFTAYPEAVESSPEPRAANFQTLTTSRCVFSVSCRYKVKVDNRIFPLKIK